MRHRAQGQGRENLAEPDEQDEAAEPAGHHIADDCGVFPDPLLIVDGGLEEGGHAVGRHAEFLGLAQRSLRSFPVILFQLLQAVEVGGVLAIWELLGELIGGLLEFLLIAAFQRNLGRGDVEERRSDLVDLLARGSRFWRESMTWRLDIFLLQEFTVDTCCRMKVAPHLAFDERHGVIDIAGFDQVVGLLTPGRFGGARRRGMGTSRIAQVTPIARSAGTHGLRMSMPWATEGWYRTDASGWAECSQRSTCVVRQWRVGA